MTKTLKKIAASVMAAATLAVGMTGMSVSANSNSYSFYTFTINNANGSWRNLPSPYPRKDTSEPVYVSITNSSFSVNIRVMGCSSSSVVGANCTCDSNNNRIDSVQISRSSSKNIYNNVRDRYNYCTLSLRSSSGVAGDNVTGSLTPR